MQTYKGFDVAANRGDEVVQASVPFSGLISGVASTRDIKRYEFNGLVNTEQDAQIYR